jgi:4-hydroxy-tetrahydrodipicolinate reductase
MKIVLIGYGKMGKTIERVALHRGHEIAGRMDVGDSLADFTQPVDAAIEFTQAEAAVANIKLCIDKKIPVVSGTTGWITQKPEVDRYCLENNGTYIWSSNYSLGVNLFFKLNEYLARLMDRYAQYDVTIDETHHTQKKDAPSGTAITLAQGVLKNLKRKKEWVLGATGRADQLVINAFRVDPTPGTHTIHYQSAEDAIQITHTAHSREGFALGAVLAAEWVKDKKGVFSMDDFLQL